jgi:hypothetical protein
MRFFESSRPDRGTTENVSWNCWMLRSKVMRFCKNKNLTRLVIKFKIKKNQTNYNLELPATANCKADI